MEASDILILLFERRGGVIGFFLSFFLLLSDTRSLSSFFVLLAGYVLICAT